MKKIKSIPNKAYYSIGEVSEILKIKDYVIRFWEKEFSHLKPIISKKGNRRKYSIKDINIIKYINYLVHEKGYTLAGAKNQLNLSMEKNPFIFQNADVENIVPHKIAPQNKFYPNYKEDKVQKFHKNVLKKLKEILDILYID